MADFAFLTPNHSYPGFREVHVNKEYQLLIADAENWPHPIHYQKMNDIIIVVLSQTDGCQSVVRALKNNGENFIDALGIASGLIWNTQTHEFCIFRDKFGIIPIVLSKSAINAQIQLVTSSPCIYRDYHQNKSLNRAWVSDFLLNTQQSKKMDIWRGSERIFPGEARFYIKGHVQQWVHHTLKDLEAPAPSDRILPDNAQALDEYSNMYWHRIKYRRFSSSEDEIARQLRSRISDAVSRIPDKNPCFTLSGGLDSTGILASFCKLHPGHKADAISLVSPKFPDCDESKQLDILESFFPIDLMRCSMDESWAMSHPEYYTKYCGYGPVAAPGIEANVDAFRSLFAQKGQRTIITGYGGNLIVKVRNEAKWRDLFVNGEYIAILQEIYHSDADDIKYFLKRKLANLNHGLYRQLYHRLRPFKPRRSWIHPLLINQFPQELFDPIYAMSHMQERAFIPVSDHWESAVRALDMVSRLTHHHFYDPLLDVDLYHFCAQIPPRMFLKNGHYRPIYQNALSPLLPADIIHHPKTQSFDDNIHDGLSNREKARILYIIENAPSEWINRHELMNEYIKYCEEPTACDMMGIWRAISMSMFCGASKV